MILSFADRQTEDLFHDRQTNRTRRLPADVRPAAHRKLLYLHDAAELRDLQAPPGNRLEALKGDLVGFHSIRINVQWRIVFRWDDGNAHDVSVRDYHD